MNALRAGRHLAVVASRRPERGPYPQWMMEHAQRKDVENRKMYNRLNEFVQRLKTREICTSIRTELEYYLAMRPIQGIPTLAAPLWNLAAPSSRAVTRSGAAGRRITVAKRSSTTGPGEKAGSDAAKASEAAEAGAESKAEGAATEAAGEAGAEKTASSAEGAPAAEVSPGTGGRNLVLGLVLVGFAVGTYYYTINKMKTQEDVAAAGGENDRGSDTDHLGDVEKEAEEEAMVNLHKSGLKISPKVVPDQIAKESVEEVPAQVAAVVEAAAEEKPKEASGGDAPAPPADAPPEEGKKKKKGWRKYILFGPRSGGDQGSS